MKFIITLIAISIIGLVAKAQDKPGAYSGKAGIFVYCGQDLPKTFSYQISRKESSQGDWELLKTLDFPSDKVAWKGRVLQAFGTNTGMHLPDSTNLEALWEKLRRSNVNDSLYSWNNFPYMRAASGTGWWDRSVEAGNKYNYKIEKMLDGRATLLSTSEVVSIPGSAPDFNIKPDSLAGNGTSVTISYELVRYNGMVGTRVYRGNYLRNNFEQIHPTIMYTTKNGKRLMILIDDSVLDKAQYSYYLVPFDTYGNEGKPTDTVNVYNSRPNTVPALVTDLQAVSKPEDNAVLLSWQLGSSDDVISIDVFKAIAYDGFYSRIGSVPPKTGTFLDHNVEPVTTYYYTLILNTAYGRTYPSARIPVIAKANKPNMFPPSNLKAGKEGNVVKLSWNKVGNDIRGYYVYRSDGFTKPMKPISQIILSTDSLVTYVDTLDQVPQSSVLVYAVASENTSYNISPISSRASVSGKVAFMPVPTNLTTMVNGQTVQLFWDDLSEHYPQVTGYYIYRRTSDNHGQTATPKIQLNERPTGFGINSFVDTTAIEGVHYMYSLESVGIDPMDVSGASLETGAIIPEQLPLAPGQLRLLNSEGGIVLQWTKPLDDRVKNIRILRAKKGEMLQLVETLKVESTEWTDKNISADTVYFYQLVSVDEKGRQSLPDEPLGIRTNQTLK